jgi:hypothetical protein
MLRAGCLGKSAEATLEQALDFLNQRDRTIGAMAALIGKQGDLLRHVQGILAGVLRITSPFRRYLGGKDRSAWDQADGWQRKFGTPAQWLPPTLIVEDVPGKHTGVPGAESQPTMEKHRAVCLCYHCLRFKPGEEDNCPIAQALYGLCVTHDLVTPVVRCQHFGRRVQENG